MTGRLFKPALGEQYIPVVYFKRILVVVTKRTAFKGNNAVAAITYNRAGEFNAIELDGGFKIFIEINGLAIFFSTQCRVGNKQAIGIYILDIYAGFAIFYMNFIKLRIGAVKVARFSS